MEYKISVNGYKKWMPAFLLGNMAVVFFTYSLCLKEHFSADTYQHLMTMDTKSLVDAHFSGGRYLAGILVQILSVFGIYSGTHQYIGAGLLMIAAAVVSGTFSYIIYCNSVEKEFSIEKAIAINCAMLLSVVNPFLTEWFLFPEACVVFAAALALAGLAGYLTYRFQNGCGFAISIFVLYMGLSCYQIVLGMYVMLAILLQVSRGGCRWTKENIIYVVRCLVIALIAAALSVFLSRAVNLLLGITMDGRSASFDFQNLKKNIGFVIDIQYWLWKYGLDTMPKNSLILVFGILSVILTIAVIQEAREKKQRVAASLVFVFVYIAGALIVVFAPMYVMSTLFISHRMMPSLMTVFSVVGCLIVLRNPRKRLLRAATVVLSGFLCVCVFSSKQVQLNAFVGNALDQYAIRFVEREIREYEDETGIQVTRMGFAVDENSPGYYPGITTLACDIGRSIRLIPWSFVNAVSYHTGRDLIQVDMDQKIYDQYFAGKNYDLFDEEQIVFVDDTVYVLQY